MGAAIGRLRRREEPDVTPDDAPDHGVGLPAAPPGSTPRDLCLACSNAEARDAVLAVYDDAVAQRVA